MPPIVIMIELNGHQYTVYLPHERSDEAIRKSEDWAAAHGSVRWLLGEVESKLTADCDMPDAGYSCDVLSSMYGLCIRAITRFTNTRRHGPEGIQVGPAAIHCLRLWSALSSDPTVPLVCALQENRSPALTSVSILRLRWLSTTLIACSWPTCRSCCMARHLTRSAALPVAGRSSCER